MPCEKLGYVQIFEGYISTEQSLVCKACSTLIPNCAVCDSRTNCNMCEPGYLETPFKDDKGIDRLVCLKSFCGLTGYGGNCVKIPDDTEVKNCRRVVRIQFDAATTLESCEQCEPGYYEYSYSFKTLASGALVFVQKC